jgi:membrane protease YdiL (CAAX protease family)
MTFVISWALMVMVIKAHGTSSSPLILAIMMVPGLTAIGCSYLFKHSFLDLGLNHCSTKLLSLAYAVPAVSAILMLLILVVTGIDQWTTYGAKSVFQALLVKPTLGVAMNFLFAAGEELGWRGFLHTHLRQAQVRYPALLTGIIWSVWHFPLILFSDYMTSSLPFLSAAVFTLAVTSFSVFLAWLRDQSNSVLPAALAHASHNTWIQAIIPSFFTAGALHPFFGGESGFVLAILYLCVAIVVDRRSRA